MLTLRLSPATIRTAIRRNASQNLSLRRVTVGRRGGGVFTVKTADLAAASYANTLADVAETENIVDNVMSDLEKVEKMFADQEVMDFFTNPLVSLDEKMEILEEVAKTSELQAQTVNFLSLLFESDRLELLPNIMQEFERKYNDVTETQVALVSSVVRLESEDLAQIAKVVQEKTGVKNVRIKTEIDESLVAGFTVRYGYAGSKLIDMSVKGQLEDIASNVGVPVDMVEKQLAEITLKEPVSSQV